MNSHQIEVQPKSERGESSAVAQGFDRINQPDGYLFDVPHEFLCPISHEIIAIPATDSIGLHMYDASQLATWLRIKNTSPLTNEEVDKRVVIHQELYNRMRQYFQNLLKKDEKALNDGKHAESLQLIQSHARGVQSSDPCIQELIDFCRLNNIALTVPKISFFYRRVSILPIRPLAERVPANLGYVIVRPIQEEPVAGIPVIIPPQRIIPRPIASEASPLDFRVIVMSGEMLLYNTVGVMTGWMLSSLLSSMPAYMVMPVPFGVLLPLNIALFRARNRPGGLLGSVTGLMHGLSTIAISYALQEDQVATWASPLINAAPAVLTAALPVLCRPGSSFRNAVHSFWQRRRAQPQPDVEAVPMDHIARIA